MGVSRPPPGWATVGTLLADALREWAPELLDDVGDLLFSDVGDAVWGLCRMEEREVEEVEKDCSKGLGSRSKLLRRGGRWCCWAWEDDAEDWRRWSVGGLRSWATLTAVAEEDWSESRLVGERGSCPGIVVTMILHRQGGRGEEGVTTLT